MGGGALKLAGHDALQLAQLQAVVSGGAAACSGLVGAKARGGSRAGAGKPNRAGSARHRVRRGSSTPHRLAHHAAQRVHADGQGPAVGHRQHAHGGTAGDYGIAAAFGKRFGGVRCGAVDPEHAAVLYHGGAVKPAYFGCGKVVEDHVARGDRAAAAQGRVHPADVRPDALGPELEEIVGAQGVLERPRGGVAHVVLEAQHAADVSGEQFVAHPVVDLVLQGVGAAAAGALVGVQGATAAAGGDLGGGVGSRGQCGSQSERGEQHGGAGTWAEALTHGGSPGSRCGTDLL